VYLASPSTHAYHEAWFVDSSASFHMNSHREWFYEYERYDGGDVFKNTLSFNDLVSSLLS
jgi:hypothetical protein